MNSSLAQFCFLSIMVSLVRSQSNSTCFNNYMEAKTSDFSDWLIINHLDPSPVLPGPNHVLVSNASYLLQWSFSNHSISGHSKNVTVTRLVTRITDLLLVVDFAISGNVTFSGNYTVHGSIWPSENKEKQVEGEGSWYISVPSILLRLSINFHWDQVGGTVHISDTYLPINLTGDHNMDRYMDGLVGDHFSDVEMELIGIALFHSYSSYLLRPYGSDVFKLLYLQYWEDTLKEASPEEMFACATPEPITKETTTAASSPPTTTFTTTSPQPNECPATGMDLISHPTSCSAYFICIEGKAYEQECSDGLHFNPVIKECDLPENINCTKPLPECPAEGVSFHPYPGNCTLYVICAEGTPFVRSCAEATCFDPEELKCRLNDTISFDVPKQMSFELDSDTYDDAFSACKDAEVHGKILVASNLSSQHFFICDNGLYRATFSCPNNDSFDFESQECIHQMSLSN